MADHNHGYHQTNDTTLKSISFALIGPHSDQHIGLTNSPVPAEVSGGVRRAVERRGSCEEVWTVSRAPVEPIG